MKPRNAVFLALGVVAGFLAWLVLAVGDPTEREAEEIAVVAPEAEIEAEEEVPAIEDLEAETRSFAAVPSDETPQAGTTAIAPPSPDSAIVRGFLRDAGTSEPLPEYALRIQDATGRWEDVLTDESGAFASGSPMAGGVLTITPFDDPSHHRRQPVISVERAVVGGEAPGLELSVACGPTYRFSISPAGVAEPTALESLLFLRSPDDQRRLGPDPLRAGDPPWVRFAPLPQDFDRLERIEVRDEEGFWVGTSEVVPGMIAVVLEARAVLFGKAVDPEGAPVPNAGIRFEGTTLAGKPYERKATTDGSGEFRLRRLLAGTGSVSVRALRHVPEDAALRLQAGATTRQEFVLAPVPPAGAISGRIESETGAHQGEVSVHLRPLSGGAPADVQQVLRWEERGGKQVGLFDFQALPAGEYELEARANGWFSWEPSTLRVLPPHDGARFVLRDALVHARFAFRARDAETAADLGGVFASWSLSGGRIGSSRVRNDEPLLTGFPIDRGFRWRVDRTGYAPAFGDEKAFAVEERREGNLWRVAEIELRPGWGEVFRVIRRGNRKPISGAQILLDGMPAGKTKGDGTCFVTAKEKPRTVEIEYREWKVAAPPDLRPAWRRKEKRFVEIEAVSGRR